MLIGDSLERGATEDAAKTTVEGDADSRCYYMHRGVQAADAGSSKNVAEGHTNLQTAQRRSSAGDTFTFGQSWTVPAAEIEFTTLVSFSTSLQDINLRTFFIFIAASVRNKLIHSFTRF